MSKPLPAEAGIALGLVVFLAASAQAAEAVPERADGGLALPQWEDSSTTSLPGSGLWPDDFNPALIVHPAMLSPGEGDAAQAQPAEEVQAEEDSWLRFLPRSLFSNRKQQPAIEPVIADLPAEHLRAIEDAPGDDRVLDPQGILGEAQSEELTRLLAFHAENAGVEARFLLLDADQQLPPGTDLSRIASGEIVRGSVCLVVYPLGAPQRARLFLTRNVTQEVPPAYLESLAAACRRDAAETPDAAEQLQRFATQLSIRLFWLERAYPTVKPEPVLSTLPTVRSSEPPSVQSLSEVTLPGAPPARDRLALDRVSRQWLPYVGLGLAGLLCAAMVSTLLIRWRRRRHSQSVWLLSDDELRHPARFGGPHCGGCGASVKYG